ncbi:MAG: SulP family inorganic anion transporter [Bacteroidia bacterium]|nr:SulP family inorganic anion transporter [Bacteroidia bacterium]
MLGKSDLWSRLKTDLPSGIVVYFVALPLCLAIAQVSTGHSELLFSGIIAGVIGGIVVGALSGSQLGVSGPAAGLVVIVSDGINKLGLKPDGSIDFMYGFQGLVLAVALAGILQLIAGYLKAGIIGNYFPSAVIRGMLAAIGITIILKEIPHALGYDKDFMGDESFSQTDGHNTFSEIYYAFKYNSTGAILIAIISISLLIFLERKPFKNLKIFKFAPAALFVVLIGIFINYLFNSSVNIPALEGEHLVQLPIANNLNEFLGFFKFPDLGRLSDPNIYAIALTIAVVASVETLLSLEATDKIDPQRRVASGNRELKAQGIGNIISGLIGGLPITQVIVRSSANINAGANSKLSTIIHGIILLLSAMLIPRFINLIPLASLSAILILVGYKLAKVSLFKEMYKLGWTQLVPFLVTIIAILATNLLKGIGIGMLVAFLAIIRESYRNTFQSINIDHDPGEALRMELSDMVTFINKGVLLTTFNNLPQNTHLIIDGSKSKYIDHDVLEVIHEFRMHQAKLKSIRVELINIPEMKAVPSGH